jgi:hypothetical protein
MKHKKEGKMRDGEKKAKKLEKMDEKQPAGKERLSKRK